MQDPSTEPGGRAIAGTDPQTARTDPRRRRLVGLAAAGTLAALAPPLRAQGRWPERPIRLVVPFPPGGNSDALARTLAERLRVVLGTPVVVDNRPGGTTQIGTEAVARAEPDGYTMLLAAAISFTMLPNLRKVPYELGANFELAGGIAEYIAIVTARKGLGVKTLGEFVELARRQPGKLTWGSAGQASAGHLYGEMLKKHAGIDMLHVPYKGSADAAAALVGEQVDLIIDGTGLGLARGGRAVALATFFDQRHPDLPDVPALPETGLKIPLPPGGWGIAFPKGTPAPVVAQTSAALQKVLAEPDTKDKLLRASIVSQWAPPGQYGRALESGRAYYAELMQAVGMKAEN